MATAKTKGRKFDHSKSRWDLVPWRALGLIVDVLTYGAGKYNDHNWTRVENGRARYFAALQRHAIAYWGDGEGSGEWLDPESGLPHLAHAGCCVLFLLTFGPAPRKVNSK